MTDGTTVTVDRTRRQSTTDVVSMWTECPTCAGTIRQGTSRCPHCGSRTRHWWLTPSGIWLMIAAIVLLFAVGVTVGRWLVKRQRR